MKRVMFLWTIFIFQFKAIVCDLMEEKQVELYYTNVTETRCFEFKHVRITQIATVKNVLTDTIMFNVVVKNKTVFTSPYENRTTLPVLTDNAITFCIRNMDFSDAGCYVLDSGGVQVKITSFVFGKPTTPQIEITENGTLDVEKGRLLCSLTSISKPIGLNMTYTWIVNKNKILENEKYAFSGPSKSELIVKVDRTELFNMYTCLATEDHGQTSASSKVFKLYPKNIGVPPVSETAISSTIVKGVVIASLLCIFLLFTCSIVIALFRHSNFNGQHNENGDTNPPGMPKHAAKASNNSHKNDRSYLENRPTSSIVAETPQNINSAQVVKPKGNRLYENCSGMPTDDPNAIEERHDTDRIHLEINSTKQLGNASPTNAEYNQVMKVNDEKSQQ